MACHVCGSGTFTCAECGSAIVLLTRPKLEEMQAQLTAAEAERDEARQLATFEGSRAAAAIDCNHALNTQTMAVALERDSALARVAALEEALRVAEGKGSSDV